MVGPFVTAIVQLLFLYAAVWHVRRRQYLKMIGWLLFAQLLINHIETVEFLLTTLR